MKIVIHGLWHLGSVTAACLAEVGHEVRCFDKNTDYIEQLSAGKAPIYEPGLDELVQKGLNRGNLSFSNSFATISKGADVIWVTIDLPMTPDDNPNQQKVIDEILESIPLMPKGALVLISSQLPVGSTQKIASLADKIA